MPNEILRIIDPAIGQIFRLLRRVLKPPKEDNIVFVVCHSMATSSWGRLALSLYSSPLPAGWFKAPELAVRQHLVKLQCFARLTSL